MEDDDLEMQLLLSGPANEANMYELLGGTQYTMTKLLCLLVVVLVHFINVLA